MIGIITITPNATPSSNHQSDVMGGHVRGDRFRTQVMHARAAASDYHAFHHVQHARPETHTMAQESVVFENASGESRPGQARDVARYSDAMRITLGTLWIVGGLIGGTVCIVVPIVHLITTWALPLFGILMGVRAFKRRVVIYQPAGVCPACGKPIELAGGSIDDASWQMCPQCKATLIVRAGTSSAAAT